MITICCTIVLIYRWVSLKTTTIGKSLVVNFTHIAALWKQVNFVKLHIIDTKHKINTYNEYLTRSDVFPFGVDHQALNVSRD